MNSIQRHYETMELSRLLEHVESRIAAISGEMLDGPDRNGMISASWHLARSIEKIQAQPYPKQMKPDLAETLRRSIEMMRDRNNCALNAETADSESTTSIVGVSRFPKP